MTVGQSQSSYEDELQSAIEGRDYLVRNVRDSIFSYDQNENGEDRFSEERMAKKQKFREDLQSCRKDLDDMNIRLGRVSEGCLRPTVELMMQIETLNRVQLDVYLAYNRYMAATR